MACNNPRCYYGKVPVNQGEALAPCPECTVQEGRVMTFDIWFSQQNDMALRPMDKRWITDDLERAYNAGIIEGMERAAEIADELHIDWPERYCDNGDAAKAIRKSLNQAEADDKTKEKPEPAAP